MKRAAALGFVVCSLSVHADQATRPPAISPHVPCASLAAREIAARSIGLPTGGATVRAADLVPISYERVVNGQVVLAMPEYCRVTGAIAPVDPQAPPINFHINLPTSWNGKTIQLGGSGTNGVIPVALTTGMQWGPESIPPNAPYALSRGFVTYGSDSGHQNPGRGAPPGPDWTMNDEALSNFAFGQMKKTRDVAMALVDTFYGRSPRHRYYMGSSQGGREALIMAQRYPQDYDGIFSQVPVFPLTYWYLLEPVLRQQSQMGDAWIPPAKIPAIGREVLRQCDELDGLADGLVSHYMACDKKFDPAMSPKAFDAIRCPDGRDTGETCLSDAQIKAANDVHRTVEFGLPLAHGWTSIPGWPTGSESAANWKLVNPAPTSETAVAGMLANLIVRTPNTKAQDFKMADHRTRLQEFSALMDGSNPDLSAFRRRGGRLILKVNTTDYTANPRWSYAYYDKVVSRMGQSTVDTFMRFYVGVGIFHNRNVGRNVLTNELVPAYVDFIAMLDDWVETGKPPSDAPVLTSMDTAPPFAVHASLPMCRYPLYPRYGGRGDVKSAASYACAR